MLKNFGKISRNISQSLLIFFDIFGKKFLNSQNIIRNFFLGNISIIFRNGTGRKRPKYPQNILKFFEMIFEHR